ncbi:MAG: hypothetical protein FWE36_06980 [Erysipelotrichales bacterium]|nr:hypothetical protein [Erysipelotrichales bacterium]
MGLEIILIIIAFVVIIALIVFVALSAHGRRQKRAAKTFINSGKVSEEDSLLIGRHQVGKFSMSQWVFVVVSKEQILVHAEFIQISGGPTHYDTFALNRENIKSLAVQENKKIIVNIKADVVSEKYGYTSTNPILPMEFNLFLRPYKEETNIKQLLDALNAYTK